MAVPASSKKQTKKQTTRLRKAREPKLAPSREVIEDDFGARLVRCKGSIPAHLDLEF